MSREVRKVPANWQHPKDRNGQYIPLLADYNEALAWRNPNHEWYDSEGVDPIPEDYMPVWKDEEKTHFQMYESCSEGTPVSPVMETPEKLARWLADNEASASGSETASYESWLGMIRKTWAPSAAINNDGVLMSGVEAIGRMK